nr:response regulator [Hydrococcus rivularis]
MNNTQLNSFGANILVVDDTPDNLRVLSASLMKRGYQVRCVKNGAMALITAKKAPPDLILLDIKMPEMDGYEVCEKLKADAHTREIPVIFLSALDDVFDKVKAFQVGGVDYITKPFQIEEIVVRIQHQLVLRAAKAEICQLNAELEQKSPTKNGTIRRSYWQTPSRNYQTQTNPTKTFATVFTRCADGFTQSDFVDGAPAKSAPTQSKKQKLFICSLVYRPRSLQNY